MKGRYAPAVVVSGSRVVVSRIAQKWCKSRASHMIHAMHGIARCLSDTRTNLLSPLEYRIRPRSSQGRRRGA